nr:glycosyl hydrolase family 8 [Kineococcus vitellinus]
MRQQARNRYDKFKAFTWTTSGVPTAGMARVYAPDQGFGGENVRNCTVSEGMGYGMLATVGFGNSQLGSGIYDPEAKTWFDRFWRYVKYYLDENGLMHWYIGPDGTKRGSGGASDGDFDIALALVWASRLWGNATGIDYGAEATKYINAILAKEIIPLSYSSRGNLYVNGDYWGYESVGYSYYPDYFAPGWFREFYRHTGDSRWLDIIARNFPLALGTFYSGAKSNPYGLQTDIKEDGSPSGEAKFGYNNTRYPWRITADYVWNGPNTDALAKNMPMRLATKQKERANGNVAAQQAEPAMDYSYVGGNGTPYINATYMQAYTIGGLTDSSLSQWTADGMTWLANDNEQNYFSVSTAAMASMLAAGIMQPGLAGTTTAPTIPEVEQPTTPTPTTPTAPSGFSLVDFDDFTGSSLNTNRWRPYSNGAGGGSSQPATDGWHLWADPDNTVGTIRSQFSDPVIVSGVDYIVATPGAKWLAVDWIPLGSGITRRVVEAATALGQRNVFIFYNIVSRDYGGAAAGGAANEAQYKQWIDEQLDAIGNAYTVILLEPDGLPQVLGMLREGRISQAEFDARMTLMRWTVTRIRQKCINARVYHDNGHSQWLGSADMAAVLAQAGVADCDGINENISNFRPTLDCEAHANGTIDILENQYGVIKGKLGFVIDTSRNGAKTPPNPQNWQNPSGIALGARSRYNPNGLDGVRRRHGWIWCKVPGESDGPYNQGGDWIPSDLGTEPPAGTVWPAQVEHIIRNSVISTPAVSGGQAAIVADGALKVIGTGDFVGGLTQTANLQKYGRWEVKAKIDRGPGYGPLIELKSASYADGAIGLFTHRDGGADEVIFYVRDTNATVTQSTVQLDLTVQHTLTVEWTPAAIVFYVDGGKAWQLSDTSKQPAGALGLDMSLVLGTGSPIAARTSSTPQPFNLTIDSAAIYARDSGTTPSNPTTPTPGTAGAIVKDWYDAAAPPSMGVTKARQYSRAIYDAFMDLCLTTEGCRPGEMRIKRPDQRDPVSGAAGTEGGTVSEGMGYALILCAIYGNPQLPTGVYDALAKSRFDALWAYVRRYLNVRGLMNWSVDKNGNVTGSGGATDGDKDIALGLIFADRIFGSNGAINYAAAAKAMTAAIKAYEFMPANQAPAHVMLNGDQWNKTDDRYMADYFRPGHLREYMVLDSDPRWETFIATNYPIAQGYFDRTYATGMVPDESTRTGQVVPGASYKWSYNAIRHPWGVLLEYLNFPSVANELARKAANKLASFARSQTGGDPAAFKAEYELNGLPTQSYNNLAFVQAIGVASLADPSNSAFASACLEYLYSRRTTDKTYFGTGLAALASATMAGLMQRYTDKAATPNAVALAGTGRVTLTGSGRPRLTAYLRGTGTVKMSGRGQLRIPVQLRGRGVTTVGARGSLQVGDQAAALLLRGRGTVTTSAIGYIRSTTVRLFGYGLTTVRGRGQLSFQKPTYARPQVGPVAQEIYEGLLPFTARDEETNWSLLRFVDVLARGLQETDDLIRDADGHPGWSALVDADRSPLGVLAWLGQFVGVEPAAGSITEEGQRLRLREASGFQRGTPAAIRGAARQSLTGRKRVQLFERDGSAYRIRVVVFASETPDPDLTRRLVMAAKPAGINLQFVVASGMSYNDLKATGLTYRQLVTVYPTYDDMSAALPPGDQE